jgi:hypothetical protein
VAESARSRALEVWTRGGSSVEKEWASLKIPEPLRLQFSRCMFMARTILHFTSNLQSPGAEQKECFEFLVAEAHAGLFEQFLQCIDGLKESKYTFARYTAQDRDGFRCVIPKCRRSNLNHGNLESHHIIPRSHGLEHQRLFNAHVDDPENLATLCSEHHGYVTNPPTPAWMWRNIAPRLYELIGQPGRAETLRSQAA